MRGRFALSMLVLLIATISIACASRTTINTLMADPGNYRGREVTVTGTVAESVSIAERGAYLLDDTTARLWVVTDRGTPSKGARISAKGTIRQGFDFGSLGDLIRIPTVESGVVLIEASRNAEP